MDSFFSRSRRKFFWFSLLCVFFACLLLRCRKQKGGIVMGFDTMVMMLGLKQWIGYFWGKVAEMVLLVVVAVVVAVVVVNS